MATPASHDTELALDLAAAYLDAAFAGRPPSLTVVCDGNPHLVPQVESVLRAGGHLAAARFAQADHDPMPKKLGRYVLASVLGCGAMGVAFRGRDPDLGRDVAVKMLRNRAAGAPEAARRFLHEARITARLEHPAVPTVHEVGVAADGRPWMAMRLVRGETLDRILANPVRPFDRLAVFEAVCRGLAFAHASGVIHRDLKPQNVMVEPGGGVQILDWGLAKVLDGPADQTTRPESDAAEAEDPGLTRVGQAIGSPSYMPPEQAVGAAGATDRRSDVFGLGAILCHILTGLPPFVGADAGSTLRLSARGDVRNAFARLDGCGADPELIALCKRCLAPKPDDRPADAGQVAEAVANLRQAMAA